MNIPNSAQRLLQDQLDTRQLSRRKALRQLSLGALGLTTFGLLSNRADALVFPNVNVNAARNNQTDAAVLQFALNLEYLEAEYYAYAAAGQGIETFGVNVGGAGTAGTTTVKGSPMVPFATPAFAQYATEIAADEIAHVKFLRAALQGAGVQPVARPAINLKESFAAAAQAAGLGAGFDPFANEVNFLIGAFVFEDVGVTAYKGASPSISNKTFLEAAAGILAVEAYHAGIIRTLLFQLGSTAQAAAKAISDLRDTAAGSEKDQPVVLNGNANLVPTDDNAIAYSRTTREVLNIVYLQPGASSGGFFPAGLNGEIK